jgi:hypothetical protein
MDQLSGRRSSIFDQLHRDMQQIESDSQQLHPLTQQLHRMWQQPDSLRHNAQEMLRQPSKVADAVNRQVRGMMQQQSRKGASAPWSYAYAHTYASTKCGNSTQSMMCSSELSGGKQTNVHSEDGNVYVNGHLVHEGVPADPVSVSTRNGAVYVNDARVWPRQAAVEGEKTKPQPQPDQAVGAGLLPTAPVADLAASPPPVIGYPYVSLSLLAATSVVLFVVHGRKRLTDHPQPLLQK